VIQARGKDESGALTFPGKTKPCSRKRHGSAGDCAGRINQETDKGGVGYLSINGLGGPQGQSKALVSFLWRKKVLKARTKERNVMPPGVSRLWQKRKTNRWTIVEKCIACLKKGLVDMGQTL